jgi:hypothetical protein
VDDVRQEKHLKVVLGRMVVWVAEARMVVKRVRGERRRWVDGIAGGGWAGFVVRGMGEKVVMK